MTINFKDQERVKMIKFLMEIYPHGNFISNISEKIVNKTKKEKGVAIDRNLLEKLINSKLIYERDVHHSVTITKKVNSVSGNAEDFVEISEIGMQEIWELAQYFYENSPFEYIKWIIDWKDRGDFFANQKYNELLDNEVLDYIDLMSSIISPTPFELIIQNISIMRKIDFDTDEKAESFFIEITNFLERAIMLGLIHKESSNKSTQNGAGGSMQQNVDFYQLTLSGIAVLNDLYNRIGNRNNAIKKNKLIDNNSQKFDWNFIIVIAISMVIWFFVFTIFSQFATTIIILCSVIQPFISIFTKKYLSRILLKFKK